MSDKKFRPEISDTDVSVEQYDEIILGFPIWWYVAPGAVIIEGKVFHKAEKREIAEWVRSIL